MNEFLEKLDREISVLEEVERKKVIKKYQKEIENKTKEGMSEAEAIKSIGEIDEIVTGIYSDYHINSEYKSEKKPLGAMINDCINSGAKVLTDFCQELIEYTKKNTSDRPLETFFEVILKILMLVMIFMVLKLPFILVEEIFGWGFNLLFYPFNVVLKGILEFVLAIVYLICCISLGIAMFKNYYNPKKEENKNVDIPQNKEEVKIVKAKKEINNYAYVILKTFIYLIIIIPLIFLDITFLALSIFAGFLVFKGVNIIGLTIVLVGLFLLTTVMTNYITDAIDNTYKSHFFALCISIIAIIIGAILFVDNLMGFSYPKDLTRSRFILTNETLIIDVDYELNISSTGGKVKYEIDNSLKDNELLIEYSYYDEYTDVIFNRYEGNDRDYLVIYSTSDEINLKNSISFYQNALEDLKANKIYNYLDLKRFKATIFCNEKTKELLK
jgi:Predicted membrane protein